MTNRDEIELMAPVGSFETLMAAIQGKANAVYFGIGKLNMRSKSTLNFNYQDLNQIVQTCKENNIKSYVTINSVMYDKDKPELIELLEAVKKSGVNAVIASDLSVIIQARQLGIEVHISTQQNISNTEAVKFFSQYADVMVLARELNLDQIAEIASNIEKEGIVGPSGDLVKLEMFVHGALCMAISGKCYLSLHEYNHSANRGECLQLCRRAYEVTDKETGIQLEIDHEYIMSPKDLCTIQFIDKLIGAGVKVLKIEGRARSGDYVKTACECYHEALIAISENRFDQIVAENLKKKLSTVYNREFWDGYYLGQRLGEWSTSYGSKATRTKQYIAKVTNYFSRLEVAEFLIETGSLKKGDEALILGSTTGVVNISSVPEMRVELNETNEVVKGQLFSMKVPSAVRRNDKLYKLINNE